LFGQAAEGFKAGSSGVDCAAGDVSELEVRVDQRQHAIGVEAVVGGEIAVYQGVFFRLIHLIRPENHVSGKLFEPDPFRPYMQRRGIRGGGMEPGSGFTPSGLWLAGSEPRSGAIRGDIALVA
jgi:hypothetical protein